MNHRKAALAPVVALGNLVAPLAVYGQRSAKVPRIGLLYPGSSPAAAENVAAFGQGLRKLGYVEGQTIVVESRYAEGRPDRLPALAAELVRLKVDILAPAGTRAIRAATQATRAIPIVVPFTRIWGPHRPTDCPRTRRPCDPVRNHRCNS